MKVLTTSTDNQTIKFIPRQDVGAGRILLIDKDTRAVTEVVPTFEKVGNFTEATASFSLTEGSRYTITIVSNTVDFYNRVIEDYGTIESLSCVDESIYLGEGNPMVIYRDMLMCTDQEDYDKYNVQQGDYVQANTNDNTYVIRD